MVDHAIKAMINLNDDDFIMYMAILQRNIMNRTGMIQLTTEMYTVRVVYRVHFYSTQVEKQFPLVLWWSSKPSRKLQMTFYGNTNILLNKVISYMDSEVHLFKEDIDPSRD